MKKTCWILLLLAGMLSPVFADDFEDLIQACARISSNYNRAVQAGGTRFDKEFQTNLDHLKTVSRKNQVVIRRLGLGQDFNFPLIAAEIEQIYEGQKNQTGVKGSDKLHAHSDSPEGIFNVLADDVKALRKMEFTTEDGGSIKSSLETRRKLLEFRRLVDFFRKNYKAMLRNRGGDPSLQRIFNERLIRMSALANLLMEIARKKYPDSASERNLQQEVEQLKKGFDAWQEKKGKSGGKPKNHRRKSNKSGNSNRRLDGMNTSASMSAEIDYSLKNINQQLIRWEQAGFRSDDPISRGGRNDAADPADAMEKQAEKRDYEAMTQQQLNAQLQKRRQEIFRSNSSMDGFDRDAERKYLLSLPREQRRQYSDYLREFQKQGYASGEATRNAVLKIHTQMKMESKIPAKKELVQILKALDKDEERRLEKNDIKFKLEPNRTPRN